MMLEVAVPPPCRDIFQGGKRWDPDLIARGLARGYGREKLFKLATDRLVQEQALFDNDEKANTPDKHWARFVSIVKEAGLEIYGKQAKTEESDEKKSLKLARAELLQEQYRARENFDGRFARKHVLSMVGKKLKQISKTKTLQCGGGTLTTR